MALEKIQKENDIKKLKDLANNKKNIIWKYKSFKTICKRTFRRNNQKRSRHRIIPYPSQRWSK